MERAFDKYLADPATRGEPLTLSVDSRVQQALEAELLGAMTHFSAIGAAGVVMDIHTGEVLAMTSLPQLNPNAAGQGSEEARFNRATLGVYELGSTFKPFTVAMAMDSGIIKGFGQVYNCPQELHVYGHVVHDTHPYGRACTVAEIMKESSNIGTAQIADQVGAERQKSFLKKMGFLDPVRVELKERGRTLTPGSRSRRCLDAHLRAFHCGSVGNLLGGSIREGRATLCDGHDARRSEGDGRDLWVPHGRVEHRPGVRRRGKPDRAFARGPARQEPRA